MNIEQQIQKQDFFKTWWGVVLIPLILTGGIYFTHFITRYGENLEKIRLQALADTAAASFDTAAVLKLKGQPADMGTTMFKRVREQLQRIQKANPDSRFVYLMALKKDKVIFLADAEPIGSKDYSAPGDIYREATPWLIRALTKGTPFTEGPLVDAWGEWVTGCAPIRNSSTGQVIAVLGIDLSAKQWNAAVARYRWFGMAISTLMLGIVLMLILGIYFQRRSNLRIAHYNSELNEELAKRRLAEEDLQESEQRFRDLFNNSPDPCWLIDGDRFVECNNAAVQNLGYRDKADVLNSQPWQLSPKRQPDGRLSSEQAAKMIAAAIEHGLQRFEWEYMRANGEVFPAEVTLAPMMIRGKKILFFTWRDITERRKAEENRRELEERLQRAEKMEALGLLSGGVAHDLNNVLGVLGGYSELLLSEKETSNQARLYAMKIMGASGRAAAIIQDMLTLARRGVQAREVVNLNHVVQDYLKTPEYERLLAFHPSVHIATSLDAEPLPILGSPVQLGKTIMNLVSNAAEAMPKGGRMKITTCNQYMDKPVHGYDEVSAGNYVVLSVSDSGEGISAKDIKQIFEPFYTKKVMGRSGTGLGLAVVWGTVKDHDGYIDVHSEEGKGSTFTLYFPVTREEMKEKDLPINVSEYMGHGETILVVDDVEGQRDLAAEMLRKLNYKVTMVSSGEQAVAYFNDYTADLMVLDMIMDPGMDGLDTYRSVLEIHPRQKAVIVSGFSETERVNAAKALGAGAYVKKPYILEELGLAVRQELDRVV